MQQITVIGRRWRDRANNTYHASYVYVDGREVYVSPATYGYGDHYIETAFRWLDDNGYTKRTRSRTGGFTPPWRYCQQHGCILVTEVNDVSTKKGLHGPFTRAEKAATKPVPSFPSKAAIHHVGWGNDYGTDEAWKEAKKMKPRVAKKWRVVSTMKDGSSATKDFATHDEGVAYARAMSKRKNHHSSILIDTRKDGNGMSHNGARKGKNWRVVAHRASGFEVKDFATKAEATKYGRGLPRGVNWELVDMRQKSKHTIARKNPGGEEITIYANPYDMSKQGFYFDSAEDFDAKFQKNLPTEEYSLEWINGPEEDRELFAALDVSQANIGPFFDLIDELNDHDKAALYYLLRHRGMGPKEDLDDLLRMVDDDVRVTDGTSKDYVEEYIDSAGGVGRAFSKEIVEQYFDYESFGRDVKMDLDHDDPQQDETDEAVGEEYVDSIGGVSELGESAENYFDIDALVRDMGFNGEIKEFEFAGSTYTTDFQG